MRLRLVAATVSIAVFLIAWAGFHSLTPHHTKGVSSGGIPTPYLRFQPPQAALGTIVLVHGLNSNKEFMQTLAMALSDTGYEVYAIDLPGHGDSPGRFSYSASLVAITEFLDTLEEPPIVVGHSLGGALVAELASTRSLKSIVLVSPPPIPVEPFADNHVLVVSGAADAPRVNAALPTLIDAAGLGTEWWLFSDSTHSTTLFDPPKLQSIADWINPRNLNSVRTATRSAWLAIMAFAALAAPVVLIGLGAADGRRHDVGRAPTDWTNEFVRWIGALALSVLTLRFVGLLDWLNLFATDYLVGSSLLAGLCMWVGRSLMITSRGAFLAAAGAAYTIGILLSLIGSELMHLVPSGTQWLRLPVLAAAGFPLFLYDEHVLRPIPSPVVRWLTFLLTRALLWSAVVTGALLLNPESSFLAVILQYVAVFWIVLWWMSGFIARKTGEPGAAALFAALVQGWVFAAVFVRI